MAQKKAPQSNPMIAILIIIALAVGLVLGMTMVGRTQQSSSEASYEADQMDQTYDTMVREASQNNNQLGRGGALPDGFNSCYDKCREDGYPGSICFFKCVRG